MLSEKQPVRALGGRGDTLLDGPGVRGIYSSPRLPGGSKLLKNGEEAEAIPGHRGTMSLGRKTS